MHALGIGRTNAHELREFAATATTALGLSTLGGTRILRKLIHPPLNRHSLLRSSATWRSGSPRFVSLSQAQQKAYRGYVRVAMGRVPPMVGRKYKERKGGQRNQ